MTRHLGDTTSRKNREEGFISARDVNLFAVGWYVLFTALEYVFCRLVIESYIDCVWSHTVFSIIFIPLTVCFLWEKQIAPVFESWGDAFGMFLKSHPELWFGVRAVVEFVLLIVVFYFIGPKLKWIVHADWSWFKRVIGWMFCIDAVVVFLAYYGKKQTQDAIQLTLEKTYQDIEGIVQQDAIEEVFYLTTGISVFLKILVMAAIVAGVLGAAGIWVSIFSIILPYFIFSIIYTALVITGSFYATVRYWQWLLTEPPKIVIRFLFKIKRDQVRCQHCGRIIPLVGVYQCKAKGCKFKFKGHYFKWCPNCYSRFNYIDCECGLSRKRPWMY